MAMRRILFTAHDGNAKGLKTSPQPLETLSERSKARDASIQDVTGSVIAVRLGRPSAEFVPEEHIAVPPSPQPVGKLVLRGPCGVA